MQSFCIFDFFEVFMLDLGHASNVISRSLRKIQKISLKVCLEKWELICVSQVVYYLCGMLCPACEMSFRYVPHKKPNFDTLKMENILFVGRNRKWSPWCSSSSHGPRACMIWGCPGKLCHDQGHGLAHLT
jgi:hypothetical protein